MKQVRPFYSITFIFLSLALTAHSQQGNFWYFGHGAGLNFNTNPPSVLTDGQLFSYEGCSTISDSSGRLLFYTDGVSVWNRLHQLMVNGTQLKGNQSSSNAAIIVPKPGSETIYYIFTSDAAEDNNQGYFYSEVDMSLQGGLGAVTANKNILLTAPSTEKLTAVRHADGIDFWVIAKDLTTTAWYAFKVDCNGVSTAPVISHAGRQPGGFLPNYNIGCLKSSPDGKKIVAVNTVERLWEIFDFDPSTGMLSNGLQFPSDGQPFGTEFSPDSKFVYIADEFVPDGSKGAIFQYSIVNYDSSAIASTKALITNTSHYIGALQLGPDNKIYCSLEFSTALSVINFPNLPAPGCGYSDEQVDLQGKSTFRGLPAIIAGFMANKNVDFTYTISQNCGKVDFSATSTLTGDLTWQWDFGDGTSGQGQTISHTYSSGGAAIDTVRLTVISSLSCGKALAIKQIAIGPLSPVLADFSFDKTCGSVHFFDSSKLGSSPIQSWSWNFGDGVTSSDQNPAHDYTLPGTYTIKYSIQTANGCISDTVSKEIMIDLLPTASFSNTSVCLGRPVQFTNTTVSGTGAVSYTWDFGDGSVSHLENPVHTYTETGDLVTTLTVSTSNGCTSVQSKTFHVERVRAFAGNDTMVVAGQPFQLHGSGGQIYHWSPPDFLNTDTIFNPVAVLQRDQRYNLRVTTAEGCTDSDDIFIRVLEGPAVYVPTAFVPEGKNRILRPILIGIQELHYFSVYNRWGQLVFTTSRAGEGWDGRVNGTAQATGTFIWILQAKDDHGNVINAKGTVTLIR